MLTARAEEHLRVLLLRGRAEDLRMQAVRLAAAYRKLHVDDATAAADTAAIIAAWKSAGPPPT